MGGNAVRAWRSHLAVSLLAALLSACAAPTSYMGIGFSPGAASPELQMLAQRAQTGDKRAQLDLGIAYEEGRQVAVDLNRARRLYALAAMTSGGTIYVYQSSAKKGGRGGVAPVNLGPVVKGLEAAKVRLAGLKANIGFTR
jgi:TPR repeat protein